MKSQKTDMPGISETSYQSFEHGPFSLEYLSFGNGPHPVLAFHGYGRKAEDFAFLVPFLSPDMTLYSFNLFGHGRSRYPRERMERNPISKSEWAGIFQAFLDHIGADKTILMGYSLGGRTALSLLEKMPQRVEKIHLFAPDGLQRFYWYKWASRIPPLRSLIKKQIHNPKFLFGIFRTLQVLRIIDRKAYKFLIEQIKTDEQRQNVFDIWNMHRYLQPNIRRVRRLLQLYGIFLHSFFGAKDPIIPPEKGKRLGVSTGGRGSAHTLPKGHLLLDEDIIPYLVGISKRKGPNG